jgi:glycosyltransferase involved in cell wall biosynthesis
VLEAHAAGLPVIATRCGGPEEWLEDADIAIAVDDSTALQHALAEMAGRKNQDYIFTKHLRCSAEMVGEQLHDVYQKVLAEEGRKENSKAKR